jgi:5-formyltetrahydrofolate cyclo-ligase
MLSSLSTPEVKQEWRRKMLTDLIQTKTLEDCKEAGLVISKYLQSLDAFQAARTVSVFISKFPEVDTDPIVREILGAKKTCLIPTWKKSVMKMVPVCEDAYDDLIGQRKNNRCIPMPAFHPHDTYDKQIDIVIMPGLVFSKNGTRLGYGFGYYDRYLNHLVNSPHRKPLLIGVCHQSQLVDAALPCESFDHLVDMIISPSGITISSKYT